VHRPSDPRSGRTVTGNPKPRTAIWILVLRPPRERPIARSSDSSFSPRRRSDIRSPDSSDIASKMRQQTPSMLHRLNKTLFQSPNASERSLHGEPLSTIQSTNSTNNRLSRPVEPFWSGRPMNSGTSAHTPRHSTSKGPSHPRLPPKGKP
jgi:hypothetical protein